MFHNKLFNNKLVDEKLANNKMVVHGKVFDDDRSEASLPLGSTIRFESHGWTWKIRISSPPPKVLGAMSGVPKGFYHRCSVDAEGQEYARWVTQVNPIW